MINVEGLDLYLAKFRLFEFVAYNDLPERLPAIFTISKGISTSLCVTSKRLRELQSSEHTKNITSRQVGVVKYTDLERNPIKTRYSEGELAEMRKTFDQRVKDYIETNDRVLALKLIRNEKKCSLLEAKEIFNNMENRKGNAID